MLNLLHMKVSTDHIGGKLLVLAVRGEIDSEVYRSIAELKVCIALLILFYILKISTCKAFSIQVHYTQHRGFI